MRMKANNLLFLLFLLVFCRCTDDFAGFDKIIPVSGACFPDVSDKYTYPIVPGMIEWQTAKSMDEVFGFCQLPDEVLNTISTPGLIDALIHAPLFGLSLISSSVGVKGWHHNYEQFNSAKELFGRKNAGSALIAYYRYVCLNCCRQNRQSALGLEYLFTKDEILNTMRRKEKKEAVWVILSKHKQIYGSEVFPLIYLMYSDQYKPLMDYARDHPEWFKNNLEGVFNSPYSGYYGSREEEVELFVSFAKKYIND